MVHGLEIHKELGDHVVVIEGEFIVALSEAAHVGFSHEVELSLCQDHFVILLGINMKGENIFVLI